jgi:hypothetical protein
MSRPPVTVLSQVNQDHAPYPISSRSILKLYNLHLYRVLVGKPEGKIQLRRPKSRWEDNIKMDLQEVGCGGMDWIALAEDRDRWLALVSAVMNLRVPSNAGNFLTN